MMQDILLICCQTMCNEQLPDNICSRGIEARRLLDSFTNFFLLNSTSVLFLAQQTIVTPHKVLEIFWFDVVICVSAHCVPCSTLSEHSEFWLCGDLALGLQGVRFLKILKTTFLSF